jgi:hypothetical protein
VLNQPTEPCPSEAMTLVRLLDYRHVAVFKDASTVRVVTVDSAFAPA